MLNDRIIKMTNSRLPFDNENFLARFAHDKYYDIDSKQKCIASVKLINGMKMVSFCCVNHALRLRVALT